jgi:hypothetical protein
MVTPKGVGIGITRQLSEGSALADSMTLPELSIPSLHSKAYSPDEHSFVQIAAATPPGSSQTVNAAFAMHPSPPPSEVTADGGQAQILDEHDTSKVRAMRTTDTLRRSLTGSAPRFLFYV